MNDVVIPDDCWGLEQATLQLARHRAPDVWDEDGIPSDEAESYSGLGEAYLILDLALAFTDLKGERALYDAGFAAPTARINAVRRLTSSAGARRRFVSLQRAQDEMRRLLHGAKVPFLLQSVSTGAKIEPSPEMWASTRAPYWFLEGRVPVLTGGSERVPIPNADFWGLKGAHYDIPNGELFVVLIPLGPLVDLLGADTASPSAPPAPLANPPFADFRWDLDQALIWVATRDPALVNQASLRLALGSRAGTWMGQAVTARRRTWMLTRIEAAMGDDEPSPFQMPHHEAETSLWAALCRGAIEARIDADTLPAWWFADAVIQNRADPDRMVFFRRRDKPEILFTHSDGSALARSREEEGPRFDVAQVVAAFPPEFEKSRQPAIASEVGQAAAEPAHGPSPTPIREGVQSAGNASPRGVRRRGPKGYGSADLPLVEEMRALILADADLTPEGAATEVADRARGGGTRSSKITRLRKRYREIYPED